MSEKIQCVISGLGIVSSIGCSVEEFWGNILLANSGLEDVNDQLSIGKIKEKSLSHGLSERQTKRMDRFTIFSFSAINQAITSAKLNIEPNNKDRVGLLIGNSLGGWTYVEDQMYGLYQGDMGAINPYVATAWFPSAPQGEISIKLGIGGYSKTFSAERLSAGYAIEHAFYLIKEKYLDYVIAGGSEAPLTPLVIKSILNSNITTLQEGSSPQIKLGEASAMLTIESSHTALIRGTQIYAQIIGAKVASNLQNTIKNLLLETQQELSNVDIIFISHSVEKKNNKLIEGLSELYNGEYKPYLLATDGLCGNTIGASMSIDIVVASLILSKQCVPATPKNLLTTHGQYGFKILQKAARLTINNILVVGVDNYGQYMSILVKKFD